MPYDDGGSMPRDEGDLCHMMKGGSMPREVGTWNVRSLLGFRRRRKKEFAVK